jgi:NAD+--asparagine ADP-ribosyltransferase
MKNIEEMNDEEIFELRKKKIDDFKSELKSLVEKYNFGKHKSDNYDNQEEYSHTDFHFVVENETWYGETIAELLKEAIGEF